MYYIEAPEPYRNNQHEQFPVIFLAGGITNCVNWQAQVVDGLRDLDVVILNPLRTIWPTDDPDASRKQIAWEFAMMRKASCIAFWFTANTLQPITLFELGSWLMFLQMKPNGVLPESILLGVDPGYARLDDISEQIRCSHLPLQLVSSLDEHITQLRKYIQEWWNCEPYLFGFQPYFPLEPD
jgi:hypothetical protein